MRKFVKTILYTDQYGYAKFKQEIIHFNEGTTQSELTELFSAKNYQIRFSPKGFVSNFHCTESPQWVFILEGQIEIGLQDGTTKTFKRGDHFYSADILPNNMTFNPNLHGHRSRQVGNEPLVTLFLRD